MTNVNFEDIMVNYSYDPELTYDTLASMPCHSGYCSFFRSYAFNFLAVVCALGLLSNLALVVALANCRSLWGWPPGRASLFQLTLGTTIFTVMLPFFAVGIRQGQVIGDGLCKVAYMLWYGSLFAEGRWWLPVMQCHMGKMGSQPAPLVRGCGSLGGSCHPGSASCLAEWDGGASAEAVYAEGQSRVAPGPRHILPGCFLLLPAALGVAKAMLTGAGWLAAAGRGDVCVLPSLGSVRGSPAPGFTGAEAAALHQLPFPGAS
ncbi:atypical chemokine receptor 1 (Duffy blood group) [Chelydra serpentina]|uniref:Atypical chemokine receptor 1 n=1 Tax=Chelydra serpentina TaxID=8475 RepID=A0A8T1RXW7_CHESE|nr:atypical chemokine receptor 1 (Duffy blood group) [Chelydra serpentina]